MENQEDLRMLSVEEVAKLMCLSKSQIRTLMRERVLPGVQIMTREASRAKWLIPAKALREFIEKSTRAM